MAKILIAGCGDIGARLATELVKAGHEVIGLRRSAFSMSGVQSLCADVTAPASLHFPTALDYVFIILSPGETGEAAYRRVYLDGTRHVLQALSGQILRRIFWVSSSSVYAQNDGAWVDEDSATEPVSASAQILLETEAMVERCEWPATVLRFAGIYGPGRLRLMRWLTAGRAVQAQPPLWTNRIHAEDCAGILAFICAQDLRGVALAQRYIGVDDEPVTQQEVLDWLADELMLSHVAGETRASAGSNKRLSNKRISALGYKFRFPSYREGYRDVIKTLEKTRLS
jgi:nucleoside-diphosphate-sugar epimerase